MVSVCGGGGHAVRVHVCVAEASFGECAELGALHVGVVCEALCQLVRIGRMLVGSGRREH